MSKSTVFISYRREDCTGYAGRLEDTLERALGKGSVFRDIQDIEGGESFADVIHSRLAGARAVLVLIGPRWAGSAADGRRRIDQEDDFVRLEIATALAAKCKVIPVLLSGATLPPAEQLPEPLRTLSSRQALCLNEASWDADMERLVDSLDLTTVGRKRMLWAAVIAALAVAGVLYFHFNKPAPQTVAAAPAVDHAGLLLGTWQGTVRYGWGDKYEEQFVFERFAGSLTGTASFLKYPRGIEDLIVDGNNISFVTHSMQSMGEQERELTHHYAAELQNDVLRIRLHTTGGFATYPPYTFEARRGAASEDKPEDRPARRVRNRDRTSDKS